MATTPTIRPLRDGTYVGLGLAVLAAQQANDAYEQFEKRVTERNAQFGQRLEQAREQATAWRARVEETVTPYAERIQERIDQLVERLPEPAQKTYKDARTLGAQVVESFEKFVDSIPTDRGQAAKPVKPRTTKAA